MNPPNDHAERVWERTLPQIRLHRRRRRNRRIAAAAAVSCTLLGIWLALPTVQPTESPVVVTAPAPPKVETIAVMRIGDNGSVRLEELASSELGSIELAFGLTPLVSDELQDW
jgi:hypothetical protein